jgi:hypothetical protein
VAITGWLLDKSAAARAAEPVVGAQLDLWVVHSDRDFERIAEVRSLVVRRLG